MGISSIYYLHGILLPSGALISELTDTSPAANTEELVGYSAGHHLPLFRGIRSQTPDASFTANAVGQVIAAIVAGGNNYGLSLSGNTDLQYRQGTDRGTRAAVAGNNERLRMNKGFLLWNTIEASHQQDASIACRLVGVYDSASGNNPVVQVGTGALTGTPAAVQFYTLGPVKINGSLLGNEQSWSLASGATAEEQGSGGELWNSYVGIKTVDPVVTITTLGKPWSNYPITGVVISSLELYLRAQSPDGGRVADDTASHIKITATNGLVLPESASGGANDPAISTLRIGLRAASGSADVLTINTASTIA